MSATIFLDVEAAAEKTIFVDVRNTSDKDIDVASLIKSRLEQKGYAVVASAQQASYVIQANVLRSAWLIPRPCMMRWAPDRGGPLAGGVAGALIGGNRTSNSYAGAMNGAGIGGLIGGAGEMIAGSLVKDVTYSMITNVQIVERRCSGRANRAVQSPAGHRHARRPIEREHEQMEEIPKTRIASTANKVNLEFSEALPHLEEQLAKSVAGIFLVSRRNGAKRLRLQSGVLRTPPTAAPTAGLPSFRFFSF